MNKRWSDNEIIELLELRDRCVAWCKIAEKLGRTYSACKNKYHEVMADFERSEAA